jgi:hypothetical protein
VAAETVVAQSVLSLFDAISLLSSIVSLVLSILAIWLTMSFKRDADKVNQDTTKLLIDIRSDAKAITEVVMPELRAYGETMRGSFAPNRLNQAVLASTVSPSDLDVGGNREKSPTPSVTQAMSREP